MTAPGRKDGRSWPAAVVLLAVLVLALAGAADAQPAGAEKRVALLVGNSTYQTGPLRNPANDARAMAASLRKLGFDVLVLENADYRDFRRAIVDFGTRLRQTKGVGLFFYAGHGLQVNGKNFMVPVDARIDSERMVEAEAVDVGSVLAEMDAAETPLNIVILDACRDNPFARSFRSAARGLAYVDAPTGTLIAYATAPGRVAADGEGANGVYTAALLRTMSMPGLKIEDMFKKVRGEVQQQTGGKQVPWESSSLLGDFAFSAAARPGGSGPATAVAPAPASPSAMSQGKELYRGGKYAEALPLLTAAAKGGSGEAAYYLGRMYGDGQGVQRDDKESARWLHAAAEAGDATAMLRYGSMFEKGRGVPRDDAEALRWYRKAGDIAHPRGLNAVGYMYEQGKGVPRDYAEALRWYRKAGDAGEGIAMSNLGRMYTRGLGVPRDDTEALRWLRAGVDKGEPWAMTNLGAMYDEGRGVAKDFAEALAWYRKAASLGHPRGIANVGWLYAEGRGVPKNEAEAVALLRKASDLGDARAMTRLGVMYEFGRGVAVNYPEALGWYRKAVDGGDSLAMNNLGRLYANGRGVTKDPVEAVRWYRQAADAAEPVAMANLGWMYHLGAGGLSKDDAEALRLIRAAAATDNPNGMHTLGVMYEHGHGVPADKTEAVKWYRRAAEAGDTRSKERLERLGEK